MPKMPERRGSVPIRAAALAPSPVRMRLADSLVTLETATPADATPRMAEWLADPAAADGLNVTAGTPSLEEFRRYIAAFDNVRRNLAVIRLADSRKAVGLVMFDIDPRHRLASFHVLIGEKAARTGLVAVSVANLLVPYLFTRRNVEKVTIEPLARNRAAVRLCERFGYRKEGVLKAQRRDSRTGERLDQLVFGVTREEFDAWQSSGGISLDALRRKRLPGPGAGP